MGRVPTLIPLLLFICVLSISCTNPVNNTSDIQTQQLPTQLIAPTRTFEHTHPPPEPSPNNEKTPLFTYEIQNIYPHDRHAFTQGLVYHEGYLYESTGQYGYSSLRKVDLISGSILLIYNLPDPLFAEGISILEDRVFQLTWKSNTGFIYDLESFILIDEFRYLSEGWGITTDGHDLIMSNGSSTLLRMHPETGEIISEFEVLDNGQPISNINELEYVNGEIYANIWKSSRIARIDALSGNVMGWIELEGLLEQFDISYQVDVLNGIAYDDENDRLFITGKFWPKIFEIKLLPVFQSE